jgi:hypothetical protein
MEKADGTYSANCHGDRFFADVVEMVNQYLASKPDPAVSEFLHYSFRELSDRFGGVSGTAFKGFPSYPQRYTEILDPQPPPPVDANCRVEPLKIPCVPTTFTEDDLMIRKFLPRTSRRVPRAA